MKNVIIYTTSSNMMMKIITHFHVQEDGYFLDKEPSQHITGTMRA